MIEIAIENDEELKSIAQLERLELDESGFIDHDYVCHKIKKRENKSLFISFEKEMFVFF